MSPENAKTTPQPLTAHEFTCKSFGLTILRANSPYHHENEDFQGGGGGRCITPSVAIEQKPKRGRGEWTQAKGQQATHLAAAQSTHTGKSGLCKKERIVLPM